MSEPPVPAGAFQEAVSLHGEGRLDEAEQHYRTALGVDPNHMGAMVSWAVLCTEQGRIEDAIALLQRAILRDGGSEAARLCLGDLLRTLSRHEEAAEQYKVALKIQPGNADAHFGLANTYQTLGRLEEAVDEYEAVIRLGPDHAQAHTNLGAALQALGRPEEAAEHCRAALAIAPGLAEAHNNLGVCLRAMRQLDEAVAEYELALAVKPDYVEALTNLGNAFHALHRYEEALGYYQAATAINPSHVAAHDNLGTTLQALDRLEEALVHHQTAVRLDPNNRQAHQSLAVLFLRRGDEESARRHGRLGFADGLAVQPYRGHGTPIPILVLVSALGGNVVVDEWLDDKTFERVTVTAEFWSPEVAVPEHCLVVNGIGDADLCGLALRSALPLLARTSAPVINQPARVLATGRATNARRLGELPGVVAARTRLMPRERLAAPDAASALDSGGFHWPLLLRSPGFHTGEHFRKLEGPEELAAAVSQLPGNELMVIQYLDCASADGKIRKYRVMMIDGLLYPLHLAISSRWMVHYMSADMADHPEHRAEDAAFLADMPRFLGPRAMEALEAIRETVGLDYGGIDFSIDVQGRIVAFEVNATMVAPAPLADDRWAYRRPAVTQVHDAVRQMLLSRAQAAVRSGSVAVR